MKMNTVNYGFESHLPENRKSYTIKPNAKLFHVLSSGIYKNKILAVIRELFCNAYDAHVAAGNGTTPVTIQLPTTLEPTFTITDYGTGIHPDNFDAVYKTYGESTKGDSQDQIGALGLGSKSPIAYTQSSFIVKNRFAGVEYTHFCFVNDEGIPDSSEVGREEVDLPNGMTVEFAVKVEDIDTFNQTAVRFFRYWQSTQPELLGLSDFYKSHLELNKSLNGDGWYVEDASSSPYLRYSRLSTAIMGNVPYPIDPWAIMNLPAHLSVYAHLPIVINFGMGELDFAASREELSYDERTCQTLISRFNSIHEDIKKETLAKLNTTTTPVELYYELRSLYDTLFDMFRNALEHSPGKIVNITDLVHDLIGLKINGAEVNPFDRFNQGIVFNAASMMDSTESLTLKNVFISMYTPTQRSKRDPNTVRLINTAIINYRQTVGYTKGVDAEMDKLNEKVVAIGRYAHPLNSTSHSRFYDLYNVNCERPNVDKGILGLVYANPEVFELQVRVSVTKHRRVTILVNDLSGPGMDRFKEQVTVNSPYVLACFNKKLTTAEAVQAELITALRGSVLNGVEVKLLSEVFKVVDTPRAPRRAPTREIEVDIARMYSGGSTNINYHPAHSRLLANVRNLTNNVRLDVSIAVSNRVKSRGYQSTKITLDELKSRAMVPYVISCRGELYADDACKIGSLLQSTSSRMLSILVNVVGVDKILTETDGAGSRHLDILRLTPSNAARLRERGVKLQLIDTMLVDALVEAEQATNFMAAYDAAYYDDVPDYLEDLISSATIRAWSATHNGTMLCGRINEIVATRAKMNTQQNCLEVHTFLTVLPMMGRTISQCFDAHGSVKGVDKILGDRYPLLQFLEIDKMLETSHGFATLVDYIERQDALSELAQLTAAPNEEGESSNVVEISDQVEA